MANNSKIPFVQLSDTVNTHRKRFNQLVDSVGDVTSLTTDAIDVVQSINELDAKLDSIQYTGLWTPGAHFSDSNFVSHFDGQLNVDTRLWTSNLEADSAYVGQLNVSQADIDSAYVDVLDVHFLHVDSAYIDGDLSVKGNLVVDGIATLKAGASNNISLGDDDTDNVIFNADVNSNILPNSTGFNLGSETKKWDTLWAENATIDSAFVGQLNVNNADIDSAFIHQFNVNNAGIDSAIIDQLNVLVADIDDAQLDSANITNLSAGQVLIDSAHISQLDVDSADIRQLRIRDGIIDSAYVTQLNVITADIDNATLGQVTIDSAQVTQLDVSQASFDSAHVVQLNADTTHLHHFSGDSGNIQTLHVSQFSADSAFVNQLNFRDVDVDSAFMHQLNVNNADFDSAFFHQINANDVHIDSAYIHLLNADSAAITNFKTASLKGHIDSASAINIHAQNITTNTLITGSQIVTGDTRVAAQYVILLAANDETTGEPTQNAGVAVRRGNFDSAVMEWNEVSHYWQANYDSSNVAQVVTGANVDNASIEFTNKTLNVKDNGIALGTKTTGNYVKSVSVTGSTGLSASGTGEGATVTLAGVNATTSVKGVASFSSDNFSVTNGEVSIKNNGVTLGTETTGNYMVNVSGTTNEISVFHTQSEGSTATIGLPDDVTITDQLSVNRIAVTKGITADSADISQFAADSANISGNLWVGGNTILKGNLTVSGTTTTVNTETIDLADNIILLNSNLSDATAPTQDGGIEVNRGDYHNAKLVWNETDNYWAVTDDSAATQSGTLSRIATSSWLDATAPISFNSTFGSITHDTQSRSDTTSTSTATHSGAQTVIDGITTNATGHVTAVNTKTITFPEGAVPNNALITLEARHGLKTGGDFTVDQSFDETISFDIDSADLEGRYGIPLLNSNPSTGTFWYDGLNSVSNSTGVAEMIVGNSSYDFDDNAVSKFELRNYGYSAAIGGGITSSAGVDKSRIDFVNKHQNTASGGDATSVDVIGASILHEVDHEQSNKIQQGRLLIGSYKSTTTNGQSNTTALIRMDDEIELNADADVWLTSGADYVKMKGSSAAATVFFLLQVPDTEITSNQQLTIKTNTGDIYLEPEGDNVIMQGGGASGQKLDFSLATTAQQITASDAMKLNATGDITLDASGDIIFDADGNNILFKNGAGADTWTWTLNDDATSEFDTPSDFTIDAVGDITLDADGNNIYFKNGGGADTWTWTLNNDATGTFDTPGAFTVDASGNFTVDASGDIILDADGNNIYLKNGGGADTWTYTLNDTGTGSFVTPGAWELQSGGILTLSSGSTGGNTAYFEAANIHFRPSGTSADGLWIGKTADKGSYSPASTGPTLAPIQAAEPLNIASNEQIFINTRNAGYPVGHNNDITIDADSDINLLAGGDINIKAAIADTASRPQNLNIINTDTQPADNQLNGSINFIGRNNGSTEDVTYASLQGYTGDITGGTYDGLFKIVVKNNNSDWTVFETKGTDNTTLRGPGNLMLVGNTNDIYLRGSTNSVNDQVKFTVGTTYHEMVSSDALGIAATAGDLTLYTTTSGNIDLNPASGLVKLYDNGTQNGIIDYATTNLIKIYTGNGSSVINTTFNGNDVQIHGGLYVGNGTAAFVDDEIRAEGDITAFYSSDITLKENIVEIDGAMDKINSIRGVYFDWTDEHIEKRSGEDGYFVRKHDVGVIAQEVEEVLPEVVRDRKDGTKAVDYQKMVALLIEGMKEQQQQIDDLKEEIRLMKE